MLYVKNYETTTKFVKVMLRILDSFFSGHKCRIMKNIVSGHAEIGTQLYTMF